MHMQPVFVRTVPDKGSYWVNVPYLVIRIAVYAVLLVPVLLCFLLVGLL